MIQTLVISVSLAIVVSSLCSVCEAVLYSLTTSQVEMLKKTHTRAGIILQDLRTDIEDPITAILTLNTIANTVGAAIAGAAAANIFGDQNVLLFSAAFTLAILIFSEIIPKTVGISFSYRLAPFVARLLQWMIIFLKPIVLLCRFITRLIPDGKYEDSVSAEEIQTIAALSRESGQLEEAQEKVISNIIVLKHKTVRQVMTPRTVTFALDEQKTVKETMKQINRLTSHSRVPVFNGDFDNVTGMIMRKDVLLAAAEQKFDCELHQLKFDVNFVAESMPLNRVLIDFFEKRQHLFVVVDEYGSVTGVISMEDVLEEIVGEEIIDESDRTRDMRELARKRSVDIQS